MTRQPETPGLPVISPSILDRLAIFRRPRVYRLAVLVALLALVSPCATRSGETPDRTLAYRTAGGVTFEVTSKGLARIGFQDRDLARGEWSVFNAGSWFTREGASGPVKTGELTAHTIEILSPTHARVRHKKGDLLCVFDYTFDGEDATIRARVENNHDTAEMAVTGFAGLEFTFGRVPDGLMQEQHITYFQAHGIGLCHPSHFSPIGGSYARDDAVGIGLSPWRTGLVRTLLLWDYTDWNPGQRERLPSRRLIYFVASPVPPRGARTFDLKLRVSPDRDWKHLLEPYRAHFQATFGPVRYKPDPRWIATDYLNHSQAAIAPGNPYGFQVGHRRIDTPEGARALCDTVIPVLKANDGQGLIVWGQGGEDPRGGMYRPDFDILPPEVETQWMRIIAPRFRDAGVRLGVTTRPHDMAVKLDWKTGQIIGINPDDPGHRAMLLHRFQRMIERGCTLFYLDSFGASFEDVTLMRWLRAQLGPDVRTYCEHQCDAIVPFSGGYSETTLHAEPGDVPPHYRLWSDVRTWEIYRWLCPGAEIAARFYEKKGQPPAGFETVDQFYDRSGIILLVPVNDFDRAPAIRALQATRTGRGAR
jgi:hypothetical protein